jgi:hypothetical protein
MKTNLIVKSTLVVILAVGIVSPLALSGAAQTKGAQQLLWNANTTVSAAPAQAPDCPTGMACAKCKNVATRSVITEKGHVQTSTVSTKHLCGNCATSSKTVGAGKAVKTVFEHTCADNGTAAASCCN